MNFFSPLMGVNFRGPEIRNLVSALQIGTTLYLERDPNNEYDANAIKVMLPDPDGENGGEDIFVGFVAKEVAEELAPLLDSDYTATATIISFLGPIKPHMEIEAVLMHDEDDDEDEADEDASDEAASTTID